MTRLRAATIAIGMTLCMALGAGSPAMAAAGSVEGTVTDDSAGHTPVAGVEVCFHRVEYTVEDGCSKTDGGGHYALAVPIPGAYTITFWPPSGLNYMIQHYNDALAYGDAEPVMVGPGATVSNIDAELHQGGTIAGTVTEAGSGDPIQGLSVCATGGPGLEFGRCTATGTGGHYTITGLRPDPEYQVEFFAGKDLNFLTQYYEGKEGPNHWDPVSVVAGATTAGIDAAMNPGAQISGRVTEQGTGEPLPEVEVCAEDPAETPRAREFEQCAFTDAAGDYTIRSLRAGTFVVGFDRARSVFDSSRLFVQWYDNVFSEAQATRIAIAPPQTRAGVDARLVGLPRPKASSVVVTLIETQVGHSVPHKCKRHFQRRKVKGRSAA